MKEKSIRAFLSGGDPRAQSYHIIEAPGAIDWRNEVSVPTEEYYDALRKDMKERHPKASPFVLDQAISVEALLDVAILSGFSLGSIKRTSFRSKGNS